MRFHNNQNQTHALKCPRCDSFNTKFCYYNNYNLSQPRHFCKNCRRYWTKGGVLRKVPVGGGSRKSKHFKNLKAGSSSSTYAPAATTPISSPREVDEHKYNSHSNTESSTFTATAATTEAISNRPISNATVNSVSENEQVNSFTSLVTASSETDAFWFGNNIIDASSFRFEANRQHQQQQQGNDQVHGVQRGDSSDFFQLQQESSPQRLSVLSHQQLSNGFGSLDWQASAAGNCLFDQSYWTHSHWSDHHVNNSSLFHLP